MLTPVLTGAVQVCKALLRTRWLKDGISCRVRLAVAKVKFCVFSCTSSCRAHGVVLVPFLWPVRAQ